MSDLNREELLRRADIILKSFSDLGIPAEVHFKFTCEKCSERCVLSQPNVLFENGDCHKCGHTTVIRKGGFLLHANV